MGDGLIIGAVVLLTVLAGLLLYVHFGLLEDIVIELSKIRLDLKQ